MRVVLLIAVVAVAGGFAWEHFHGGGASANGGDMFVHSAGDLAVFAKWSLGRDAAEGRAPAPSKITCSRLRDQRAPAESRTITYYACEVAYVDGTSLKGQCWVVVNPPLAETNNNAGRPVKPDPYCIDTMARDLAASTRR